MGLPIMHLATNYRQQAGVTLVELMVGLTVGMLVIASAITTYIFIARSSSEILESLKLNSDLRAIMDLMVSEIWRAGSWTPNKELKDSTPACVAGGNPFTVRNPDCYQNDLEILDNGKTILFAYNRMPDAKWKFGRVVGFRFMDSGIQMLQCANQSAPGECQTLAWDASKYQNIIDQNTLVIDAGENLSDFSLAGSNCYNLSSGALSQSPCSAIALTTGNQYIEIRKVNITLMGYSIRRPEFKMTLTQTVLVANDRFFTAP